MRSFLGWVCIFFITSSSAAFAQDKFLAGTQPLKLSGDIASHLVAGVDQFLLNKIEASRLRRDMAWNREQDDSTTYDQWLQPKRDRLKHILGVRDDRVPFGSPTLIATVNQDSILGTSERITAHAVSWPTIGNVRAEGILLLPAGEPVANVVAIPDADQTPELICGLVDNSVVEGTNAEENFAFAWQLANDGCRVLVPTLIDRTRERRDGGANLTRREYLYRSAFELGRHLIGYEVQSVLAAVDWFEDDSPDMKTGVIGWGEGGMLALYSAAVDPRIDAACVSGYFDRRENIWLEPVDRNVFGLLEEFGDAELACMVAPRNLVIDLSPGPQLDLPGEGGAPGRLVGPDSTSSEQELARARTICQQNKIDFNVSSIAGTRKLDTKCLSRFGSGLGVGSFQQQESNGGLKALQSVDAELRQRRLFEALDRHNQWLLAESPYVRKEFMKQLDTSSLDRYNASVEPYRKFFAEEVIGRFDDRLMDPNVHTRVAYEHEKWIGYEVVLDVFPEVIAYGVLLVPRDMEANEKRPVVVCQHGLEGRPKDLIEGDHRAYHDFAARLAERGFVTFAPQNLYIFGDRFRTLQRKANPIKKTLFSVMVPQHQQIVDWLKTLEFVDPDRIAFYGLSYGGKSAMRIPPLVPDYCLSICSADFNEWVWKNASSRSRYSYVRTGEYEIFEFDLGSTFNYAEMAALIAPRPFMVERGHNDGVAPDEAVAYEFAKVRNLYAAQLQIPDRCAIEWFYGKYQGVHTINGQGTFDFLHKHLDWPKP